MKEAEQFVNFNKILIHPDFNRTIEDLNKVGVRNHSIVPNENISGDNYTFNEHEKVQSIGKIQKVDLDAHSILAKDNWNSLVAYDESIDMYLCLEGTAYFTSHSLTLLGREQYLSSVFLTFYFYTKSLEISSRSKFIRLTEDSALESQKDYIQDRIKFLVETVPENTLLFIDGPLIAGDVYTYFIQTIEEFHKKNILPVFFVKNSSSNLVTNYVEELKGKYNSDLHWSYNVLSPGSRSNYFLYKDLNNPKNSKVFTYVKGFNVSPQRIEFHSDTFELYRSHIDELMNFIYYLLLVQGNLKNPQIRPIAVSEMYARESLKMMNIQKLMKKIGIVPTINQSRFGS